MSLQKWDSAYATQVFGLQNNGAVCYLNSLVQAILSLPAFVKKMIDHTDEFRDGDADFGVAMLNLLSKYQPQINRRNEVNFEKIKSDNVYQILKEIQKKRSADNHTTTLHTGAQEDVFEGFKFLIECLGDPFPDIFNIRHSTIIKCKNCGSDHRSNNDSCPPNIFFNMSEQNPEIQKNLNTQENVQNYIKTHMLYPEDYKCEKCNIKNTSTTRMIRQFYTLCRLSSVIVLSFHYNHKILFDNAKPGAVRNKRHTSYFPQELEFESKDGPLKYKVIAQIEQFGQLNGGHYTVKCLRQRPLNFGKQRRELAREILKNDEERLKVCHDPVRRQELITNIEKAKLVIEKETSNNELLGVFKFDDMNVSYVPDGFVPTENTYLVFYHLM